MAMYYEIQATDKAKKAYPLGLSELLTFVFLRIVKIHLSFIIPFKIKANFLFFESYMPELPEVETIKSALQKAIGYANIISVNVNDNRFRQIIPDDFAKKISGTNITGYQRIAKYIIISLDNGYSIIWHLGMSGRVKICDSLPQLEKHDHVVFETSNGIVIYHDPRRFGLLTYCKTNALLQNKIFQNSGLDPFDERLTARLLLDKLKNKKIAIKVALLDQKIICGIGNIYASEALFEAKILPTREALSLSLNECSDLIKAVRNVLKKAISAGGSTLRDYKKPDGSLGYFQNQHCVYNKTGMPCPNCTCGLKNGGVQKIVLGGRSTFFCPVKQK